MNKWKIARPGTQAVMQLSRYAKKPNIKGKNFGNIGHGNIQFKFLSLSYNNKIIFIMILN